MKIKWSVSSFTHTREAYPTEIVVIYKFDTLIPLYPTVIFPTKIRSSVLYILPFHVLKYLTQKFTSHATPPIIVSSHNTQCISINTQCVSKYFKLQSLPAVDQWLIAYQEDLHIKVLLGRLFINDPMDKPTILQLPVAYRTAIYLKVGLFTTNTFLPLLNLSYHCSCFISTHYL